MVVRDIVVVEATRDESARNRCPAGYTRVPVDLNQGAGGRWIYLCYSTSGTRTPIVALALSFSNTSVSTSAGPGVATRIGTDLNTGAGGEWIYLWYTRRGNDLSTVPSGLRGYFAATDNILEITAATSSSAGLTLPGWMRVEGYRAEPPYPSLDPDVNRGAGGKFIYLFYRRQIPLVQNQP